MTHTPLTPTLETIITKPLGHYRDETTLHETLKRRLTKKEYKVLVQLVEGLPLLEDLMTKLSLDSERYEHIVASLRKKLNYDRIKRELFE